MPSVVHRKHLLVHRPEVVPVSDVRLRTFKSDQDIHAWLSLRERAFAREKLGVRQWEVGDFHAEFLDRPWWRPDWMWFAGEASADAAVGTVALALRQTPQGTLPVVHWLCVLPAWRRRGIGRLLMTTLEQAAWDEGYRQVALETHESWRAAAACYESLGYELIRPRQAD